MSAVNLSTATLYSGTVFTLTCVVELVPEVDISVTVLTSWTKNGRAINSTDRISVDSEADEITSSEYGSDIVFNPLSNMQPGGDDGNYKCSAQVKDAKYITGNSSSGTHTISVEGQQIMHLKIHTHLSDFYAVDLRPPLVWLMPHGTPTAGEVFSLECVLLNVEGVRLDDISFMWTGPNGSIPSGDHIRREKLSTPGGVAVGRLVFSPLHTSDRGEYSCTGRISVDKVGVDVSDTQRMEISITS